MVIMVYRYQVPTEKHRQYLKATAEKIKPFWESHGCKSYDVWQAAENGTSFMKTMFFEDTDSMQKTMALSKGEGKPFVDLFYSFANDISRQAYIQKT
jgi:quinol monooxygenase YgiN